MHKGYWSRSGAANSLRVRLLLVISSGSGWSSESDDSVYDASYLASDDGVKSRCAMIG